MFLSPPPPKIFWKMFFFFWGAGGAVDSGVLAGATGTTRVMGAGLAGVVGGGGVVGLEPPMPKIFWKMFWGDSFMWAQLLRGAVPSRKAV